MKSVSKLNFDVKFIEPAKIEYWVKGFPQEVLDNGFSQTAFDEFSVLIYEIVPGKNGLTSFEAIVPENKNRAFRDWTKNIIKQYYSPSNTGK